MSSIDTDNSKQSASWNGTSGQRWTARQAFMDGLLAPVSAELFAAVDLAPGMRVLDIGCGSGGTSLALAERVGPTGEVLGADISEPMVGLARARTPAGVPARFVVADATVYDFPPGAADLLFSRFGVMFFAEPVRAFANMRKGLRPGARVTFACWCAFADNPWFTTPIAAARPLLPPQPPVDPDAPGPHAFARPERIAEVLGGAGFADIAPRRVDLMLDVAVGGGLDAAVESALAIGPLARALEGLDAAIQSAAADRTRAALAPHVRGETVPMPAAIWIVTARNP